MHRVLSYLKYLIRSIHLHGIHSPFVFQFQQEILKNKIPFYCFDEIESIRAKLLLTPLEISVLDLGAGSKKGNSQKKKISQITRTSLKQAKYAQLLYRIVYQHQPQHILEIGSSLGITSSYLAKACPKSKIITLEGSPEIAKIAKINFEKLNLENINLIVGDFKDSLAPAIQQLDRLDFVYFDGNHQEQATLQYFNQCLEHASENSLFVFDDIYWSKGMEKAWSQIKKHPKVRVSIDLYEMGILFFKSNQEKQDFTIYH